MKNLDNSVLNHDFIQIITLSSDKEVNEYLEVGWKLIAVATSPYGDVSHTLGWSKHDGEITLPESVIKFQREVKEHFRDRGIET